MRMQTPTTARSHGGLSKDGVRHVGVIVCTDAGSARIGKEGQRESQRRVGRKQCATPAPC